MMSNMFSTNNNQPLPVSDPELNSEQAATAVSKLP